LRGVLYARLSYLLSVGSLAEPTTSLQGRTVAAQRTKLSGINSSDI